MVNEWLIFVATIFYFEMYFLMQPPTITIYLLVLIQENKNKKNRKLKIKTR